MDNKSRGLTEATRPRIIIEAAPHPVGGIDSSSLGDDWADEREVHVRLRALQAGDLGVVGELGAHSGHQHPVGELCKLSALRIIGGLLHGLAESVGKGTVRFVLPALDVDGGLVLLATRDQDDVQLVVGSGMRGVPTRCLIGDSLDGQRCVISERLEGAPAMTAAEGGSGGGGQRRVNVVRSKCLPINWESTLLP